MSTTKSACLAPSLSPSQTRFRLMAGLRQIPSVPASTPTPNGVMYEHHLQRPPSLGLSQFNTSAASYAASPSHTPFPTSDPRAQPPPTESLFSFRPDGSTGPAPIDSQNALVVGARVPQRPSHMTEEEFETHEQRLRMQQKVKAGKSSSNNYGRHVAGYVRFWEQREFDRAQHDHTYTPTPAHPITVTKSCIFLKYECERPKRSGSNQDIPGAHVGLEHVKQCISALEEYRRSHQHESTYALCTESHVPLRTDARIRQFEISMKASEPERIANGQKAKATGTSSDTYKTSELKTISMSCLKGCVAPSKIIAALRDRCMLLLSTYTAFRGDSTRMLLFSDLGVQDVDMPEIAEGAAVMAMVLLRDQGKHIQDGRVEEHAAFRHRDAELCCIGAMALYLFGLFHIAGRQRPDFAPDFSSSEAGEFGLRKWYSLHVFPGRDGDHTGISYEQHNSRVNYLQAKNGVQISSKTHAGRHYAAKNMRDNRASRAETKSVGKWSMNGDGAYDRYDHSLPIEGMLASAGFSARHPEAYMIVRNCLEPPQSLVDFLFPWVEEEQHAMAKRREEHGAYADDYALKNFLGFLQRARRILLQDAACLYIMDPSCDFFRYQPFNSDAFRKFALSSAQVLADVEQAHRTSVKNLPTHLADAFRGVVAAFSAEQRQMQNQFRQQLSDLESACIAASLEPRAKRAKISKATSRLMRPATPDTAVTPVPPLGRMCQPARLPPVYDHVPGLSDLPSSTIAAQGAIDTQVPVQPEREAQEQCLVPHSTSGLPNAIAPPPDSFSPTPPSAPSPSASAARRPTFNPGVFIAPPAPAPTNVQGAAQDAAFTQLKLKYGEERVARHVWTWIQSATPARSRWVPHYLFARKRRLLDGDGTVREVPLSVEDVWHEHVIGLDGQLSVSQLNAEWGSEWRRGNNSEKSEAARRGRVIDLINQLSQRPNWSAKLALKFLTSRYPVGTSGPFRTLRHFVEYIQKKDKETGRHINLELILRSADTYHGDK